MNPYALQKSIGKNETKVYKLLDVLERHLSKFKKTKEESFVEYTEDHIDQIIIQSNKLEAEGQKKRQRNAKRINFVINFVLKSL